MSQIPTLGLLKTLYLFTRNFDKKVRGTMPIKEEKNGVLFVDGEDVTKVAFALSSPTRLKILELLRAKEFMDIDEISKEVGKSKANISTQIKILEDAGLVKTKYAQGKRGVKKICTSDVKEIVMLISPFNEEKGVEREASTTQLTQ